MNNKQLKQTGNWLTAGLMISILIITSACSSKTSSTTSTPVTTTVKTTGAPLTLTPVVQVSYIIVTPGAQSYIAVGDTKQYTATAAYTDGSSVDVTAKAQWTCSNPTVATVNAGVVTGVAIGSASITATLDGTSSGTIAFFIKPPGPDLTSIAVSRDVIVTLKTGVTLQLKATGTYADFTAKDIASQVTWVSSDPKIATVSATGMVTTIAAGKTTISASYLGVTSIGIVLTIESP